ncbi:LptF/LptG family permease [Campylobacter sp. RM9344]|uniref:LptF/LptG family permease n=1 Tax=Campylobacter californiensis TaxID=1032243 RepID=A0AAW3ZX70_9BACT|nr:MULTISPECIES: LptF/LptG family permease [unclassified Campylobacter]MBE2984151.1 LptF/LptG family permease [Campylobacter sp. RM6883]MBE2986225.1 LptF/LptG family permease [Campylobacter sp. RM12919]MBE2988222.1 LptF/LptG family permease [Campylobacter sp. RM12920]MBE2995521.1 LptF/LptG family permease [Campylobacter sp. RM6913]MBE3029810.1 LptF/LptG family permease [Campylobacter sp. RM9344]
MNLYARYVGWVYLKSFLIIFLALELFYVGIDLLTNLKDLPSSANLQLLYVGLTMLTATSYVMPISLVFAIIVAHINMVRSNELISFYALGVSKNALILPPFFISLCVTIIYVGLNCTPFAYAYEFQKNIANATFGKSTTDTFLKFEGKFIYIKELNLLEKTANDLRIFDINGTNLVSTAFAKSADFQDNRWLLKDMNVTYLPSNLELGAKGLEVQNISRSQGLKGFTPKSIQSANTSERTSFSIPDVLDFIFTFKDEGVELDGAKSVFYTLAIAPFFAPFLVLILYYHLPVTGRFFNLAFATFVFVVSTLVVWGLLFVLGKFSQNSVILPELGIVLPVFGLMLYALYLLKTHR